MMCRKKWCEEDRGRAVELFMVAFHWCCLYETVFAVVGYVEVIGGE